MELYLIVNVYQGPIIQIQLLVLAFRGLQQPNFLLFLSLPLSWIIRSLSLIKNNLALIHILALIDLIPSVWANSTLFFCYWNHTLSLRANLTATSSSKIEGPHSKDILPNLATEIHPLLFLNQKSNKPRTYLNSHWHQQIEEKNKCSRKKKILK